MLASKGGGGTPKAKAKGMGFLSMPTKSKLTPSFEPDTFNKFDQFDAEDVAANFFHTVQNHHEKELALTIYNTETGMLRDVVAVPHSAMGKDGALRSRLGIGIRHDVDPVPHAAGMVSTKTGQAQVLQHDDRLPENTKVASDAIRAKYAFGFAVTGVTPNSTCDHVNIDVNHDYIVGADNEPFHKNVSPTAYEPRLIPGAPLHYPRRRTH